MKHFLENKLLYSLIAGERESSNLPLPSQVVGAGVGPPRGVGAVGVGPLDPRRNEVTAQPTAMTLSQLQQVF